MINILKSKGFIGIVSILVPVAVAILILLPQKLALSMGFVKLLPSVNATLNSLTTLLLIAALIFIKSGNIKAHQWSMQTGLILGALFLISYVVYHASAPSTLYGDMNADGIVSLDEKEAVSPWRTIYLWVLSSHILLAIIVLPLVLMAFYHAWNGNFISHKKIVKYTYPVWLYVSVTGVIVYWMISPFYPW